MPSGKPPAAEPVVACLNRATYERERNNMNTTAAKRVPIGTRARTGEICPESGVWKVEGTPSTTAPIAKGNRMPPYDGKAVTWVLSQYA